jgi:hypothetical protein
VTHDDSPNVMEQLRRKTKMEVESYFVYIYSKKGESRFSRMLWTLRRKFSRYYPVARTLVPIVTLGALVSAQQISFSFFLYGVILALSDLIANILLSQFTIRIGLKMEGQLF